MNLKIALPRSSRNLRFLSPPCQRPRTPNPTRKVRPSRQEDDRGREEKISKRKRAAFLPSCRGPRSFVAVPSSLSSGAAHKERGLHNTTLRRTEEGAQKGTRKSQGLSERASTEESEGSHPSLTWFMLLTRHVAAPLLALVPCMVCK